jgi:heat shock protein HtpX
LTCGGLGKPPAHDYLGCGMNIMQMTKRIFLLLVVNILVMTTITLVLGLLHVGGYFPEGGLAGLAVFCLVWGFGGWLQFLLVIVFQILFSILDSFVVCWFSRQREFRADAGGARLAGRENMINALRALAQLHDPEVAAAEAKRAQTFQSLKISGQTSGLLALLATHPPIAQRIARLEQGAV